VPGEDGGEFASGKLAEHIAGRLKRENRDLYPHTALVEPGSTAEALLSELERATEDDDRLEGELADTTAARMIRKPAATSNVGGAVSDLATFAVGLTERNVEISEAQALVKIARSIYNERAPYNALIFGATNRGKTGFAALWAELWKELLELKYGADDGLIVSNMKAPFVDELVRDFPSWRDLVLGDAEYVASNGELGEPPEIPRSTPVWWHFDECSTHLDARTKSAEVSELYLPAVKLFAKAGVDAVHLGHSTLDIYKDLRRNQIATEVVVKTGLKTAEVYEHATEQPTELKYVLEEIPETSYSYDPDDYSPWSWE